MVSSPTHVGWGSMSTPLPPGTPFQQAVWQALLTIPRGEVRTYRQIAEQIGRPKAARAVANACGANPDAPSIPCHRVVGSNGQLGGYSGPGGQATKRRLLLEEGVEMDEGRNLNATKTKENP